VVEELVRNKSKERLLAEAGEMRGSMKAVVSAAELIREDRMPDRAILDSSITWS